jgi:hypothetical protein
MITPEDIRQVEARTNVLHERIDETFAVRDRSDDLWRHWENACSEFRFCIEPLDQRHSFFANQTDAYAATAT